MSNLSLSRSAVTMNTANDMLTIIAAANRKFKVVDFIIGGNGATSAAAAFCEVGLYLSTGGTTGGGALTPKKWETDAPTVGFTNFTTWSVQPTLSGDPYYRMPFNNYGGVIGKPIKPIGDIIFRNLEQLSIRPISGTSAVTFTIVIDEI
jgi:hypothetical protein